jgi:hypothetical protein
MYSKLGTTISTILMLGFLALWSVSVLAADGVNAEHVSSDTAVEIAAAAHQEAAEDAIRATREEIRLDLDIQLIGRTSVQVAAE